jgi:cystathionine gamma-lyase
MPTLDLRLAAQQESALAVARGLVQRTGRGITAVHHPGLPDHPDRAIAARQMRGGPGLVTLVVPGGVEGAKRFFGKLRLIARAPSLGGVESVASLPVFTTHATVDEAERRRAGIDEGMVRISVGLEGADAILADILASLEE